jgi:hypothetical protein
MTNRPNRHDVAALDALNMIIAFREGRHDDAVPIADLYIEKGQLPHLMWSLCFNAGQLLSFLDQANLGDSARRRLRDMYLRDGS